MTWENTFTIKSDFFKRFMAELDMYLIYILTFIVKETDPEIRITKTAEDSKQNTLNTLCKKLHFKITEIYTYTELSGKIAKLLIFFIFNLI